MGRRRALEYDCAIRDVLDRIGDAWSVLVIMELSKGPCRFNALRRVIEAISQRMLSVTLRNLERDGLVSRQVLDTSPPQVEYSLTQRGPHYTAQSAIWRIGRRHISRVFAPPALPTTRKNPSPPDGISGAYSAAFSIAGRMVCSSTFAVIGPAKRSTMVPSPSIT